MSWPVFRTDPAASRRIAWWACAAGYAACLLGVPLVAGGLHWLAMAGLEATGLPETAAWPAIRYVTGILEILAQSLSASYMGAILSLPVVIWAQAKGWCGWGTAMLTGAGICLAILGGIIGVRLADVLSYLLLPSALLGLAFWITVRLLQPAGFRPR